MITAYLIKLSLTLEPVHHVRPIPVQIGIDKNVTKVNLESETTIHFEFESGHSCNLVVEMLDKQDQEAVVIKQVDFFGIADPRFAWAGVYEPQYPELWASQQKQQGIELKSKLCPHTYLGWTGKWTLTFDVPVFTWMHKIQNLGWIYA